MTLSTSRTARCTSPTRRMACRPRRRDRASDGIYRLAPDGTVTRLAVRNAANGLAFSPDESRLYVSGGGEWTVYIVAEDGTIGEDQVFLAGGMDGLTIDAQGNLWATGGDGVWVISPEGCSSGHDQARPKSSQRNIWRRRWQGALYDGRDRTVIASARTWWEVAYRRGLVAGVVGAKNVGVPVPDGVQTLLDTCKLSSIAGTSGLPRRMKNTAGLLVVILVPLPRLRNFPRSPLSGSRCRRLSRPPGA